MKTATVRDLRNHYTSLLGWISAGEDVVITRKGKVIARLVPERPEILHRVDWTHSPAVDRDRSALRMIPAKESRDILSEAGGKW